MCAAGSPAEAARDDVRGLLRRQLGALCQRVPAAAAAIDDLEDPHAWAMADRRSHRWYDHRVALCGDSAVGFMPTIGVGASVAMRAAAGLADEVSRADGATGPLAFERYEKRCRGFAERAEVVSRYPARPAGYRQQRPPVLVSPHCLTAEGMKVPTWRASRPARSRCGYRRRGGSGPAQYDRRASHR